MMQNMKKLELWVGTFMLLGMIALLVVMFKITNIGGFASTKTYNLTAEFTNIGGLKVRSPVKVGGVKIGEVSAITLDTQTRRPKVTLTLNTDYGYFPDTSTASIYTSGMLGEQYVGLIPGFEMEGETELMKDGDVIGDTNSAIVLEDLIGKVLYSLTGDNKSGEKNADAK